MAVLANSMPPLIVDQKKLCHWGKLWLADKNLENGNDKKINAFDRYQSVNFASFIDKSFGEVLATALGGIPVRIPVPKSLLPAEADCVEVGTVRIIGGIRPQNFDAAYRPDGPRVVFDSKTLNDAKSIGKNWQNMINDLATEAATVHTRFPYAIVVFIVVLPLPAVGPRQKADIIRTLERLGTRRNVLDQAHLAEAIGLVFWDPETGFVSDSIPAKSSNLRIEKISETIFPHYLDRYKGLPPHSEAGETEEEEV